MKTTKLVGLGLLAAAATVFGIKFFKKQKTLNLNEEEISKRNKNGIPPQVTKTK